MRQNPQFPADLVTFAEEILNGKLHFLCIVAITGLIFLSSGVPSEYLFSTTEIVALL